MSAASRDRIVAVAILVAATAALLAIRPVLDKTHVALAYLLVVLIVSARTGRVAGLVASGASFLCFNFFFLEPFYTLTVADPINWAVLGAFLITSLVAAQLLARAQFEAAAAGNRANEVARLATLGSETLNAARADDALQAIVDVVRSTLSARRCEIIVPGDSDRHPRVAVVSGQRAPEVPRQLGQPDSERLVQWVLENGRAATERRDGATRLSPEDEEIDGTATLADNASRILLPLRVRGRTVGVLTLTPTESWHLDGPTTRFLEALSYYAALGIERRRLTWDAERAEALRKADEVKNAVLASVSHDLRTPLTTIKALAHEIGQSGDDRALIIEEEADRLNRFVADLLDLSRLSGGALHVEPVINAAEDLVGSAIQRVAGAVGDRTLVASLDPAEPLLLGRFDFAHSLRILVNLLENGLKYAPPGSTVEVEARRVGPSLEFVVSDRGPGVPVAEREQIFTPFHRVDGVTRDATGAGLGLSIARGLAEAQGGAVRFEPRAGGGSLFVLSLPAADVTDLEGGAASL